jgi:hypothetical protein
MKEKDVGKFSDFKQKQERKIEWQLNQLPTETIADVIQTVRMEIAQNR